MDRSGICEHEPAAQRNLERKTRETEIRLDFTIDGTGEYDVETGVPVLRPHARVVREARPLRPARSPRRATSRSTCTTRSRTSASRSARPSARRSATRAASAATAARCCRWPSRRPRWRWTSRNRAFLDLSRESRQRPRRHLRRVAGRGLPLRARAERRARPARRCSTTGRARTTRVEAIFKGLARALRQALEIDPRQTGLPTVKGAL